MKILNIVGEEFKKGYGISTITHELTKELNLRGVTAELLLLKPVEFDNTYYVVHQNISDYNSFFDRNMFNLVIFHGLYFIKYIEIANYLNRNKIPYLIKPHSSLMKASHNKSWIKKKVAFFLVFNRFINNSFALLFSNEEEKENSIFRNKKYYLETNGIALPANETLNVSAEEDSNINLLFLSRIDFNHKGIDYLINGFEIYKRRNHQSNVKLMIYGSGNNKELSKLNKIIRNNLDISFMGPIFGPEKDELLRRSNILILTSRYEGFPTIFIDVLSKGIPCIVTPGTNAGFFEKEKVGWLAELSASSIAHTIERAILDYSGHKHEIKKRCILFAQEKFDIRNTVFESIRIYQNVLESIR